MLPTASAPPSWLISQFRAGVDRTQFRRAVSDLWCGLSSWPLWGYLGYHEIRQRYRRSVLGPFWIAISMGVMVLALGLLYGSIFKQPLKDYLPYVTAGFVVWGLLSSFITDGLKSFIKAGGLIRQMSVPLSVHVYRLVWGNLIIFGHNLLVYVAVASWFQVDLGWSLLLAPLAIGLLVLNGVWIGLLFGLLSARFRDIPLIVGSMLQVVFFLTPVIWRADMLPGRALFVHANPMYHLLEVIRGPLLGYVPSLASWLAVVLITLIGWTLTLLALTAYRWRIPYWV